MRITRSTIYPTEAPDRHRIRLVVESDDGEPRERIVLDLIVSTVGDGVRTLQSEAMNKAARIFVQLGRNQ